jgi:hypothetical protein
MLRIFNAYAVSGFYFGHAVYIRVEVIIPWRFFAYYCDSVAACHVILMAAMLSRSCYAYLFARVLFSSGDILRRICYQGFTIFGCGVEETQGKQVNR